MLQIILETSTSIINTVILPINCAYTDIVCYLLTHTTGQVLYAGEVIYRHFNSPNCCRLQMQRVQGICTSL